jgi:hypothetical protein
MGTVVCWKTLVPHTGKAVAGVCPGVVHVCAPAIKVMAKNAVIKRIVFILNSRWLSSIARIEQCKYPNRCKWFSQTYAK